MGFGGRKCIIISEELEEEVEEEDCRVWAGNGLLADDWRPEEEEEAAGQHRGEEEE